MHNKIYEFVDNAYLEGIIEAECKECGLMIQCELDATSAYCDICEKTVRVKNFLIDMGFM